MKSSRSGKRPLMFVTLKPDQHFLPRGEVRELVETIRLESGHTLTGIVGSNPTLSARFSVPQESPREQRQSNSI